MVCKSAVFFGLVWLSLVLIIFFFSGSSEGKSDTECMSSTFGG